MGTETPFLLGSGKMRLQKSVLGGYYLCSVLGSLVYHTSLKGGCLLISSLLFQRCWMRAEINSVVQLNCLTRSPLRDEFCFQVNLVSLKYNMNTVEFT